MNFCVHQLSRQWYSWAAAFGSINAEKHLGVKPALR